MSNDLIKDTLVRRVLERGTSSIVEPASPITFMGETDKEQNDERLALAGDLWIMSGKGTTKIKLSEMRKAKSPEVQGFYISTGKGTGRRKI